MNTHTQKENLYLNNVTYTIFLLSFLQVAQLKYT